MLVLLENAPLSRAEPQVPTAAREHWMWALFLLMSTIWGSSYLFIDVALEEGVAPFTVVGVRVLIGAAFLAIVLRVTGGRVARSADAWRRLTFLGIVQIALPFALITWGQQYIPSGMAGVLNGVVPLFAVLLASVVLHDEPVTASRSGGLLVGFGGVIILALPSLSALAGGDDQGRAVMGMAAVVAASFSYAVAAVYARHRVTGHALMEGSDGMPRAPRALEIAFAQLAVAGVIMAVLAIVFDRNDGGLLAAPPSEQAWFALLWLGVMSSGVAFILFFRLIATWGATRTTMVAYVMPVVALALGFVFLGERLQPLELAGAALIIGGIVLVNASIGRRALSQRVAP